MTIGDTTASRFLRPADVARLRRNQRQIQVHRLIILLRNVAVLALLGVAAIWIWRLTQSSARFAVKTIEIAGAVHTPHAQIELVTRNYEGLNLFQIDLARVRRDLGHLGWVRRIDIEKKLPDTLRIKITEREPVALARIGDALRYVDEDGAPFADLSPSAGDDDLPLITDAAGAELQRTVAMLRELRAHDRDLYLRVSEVRPVPPRGFAIYDRQLRAFVYAGADDLAAKWRGLYAIVKSENDMSIEYADLRFADRVIVKALETSHVQN
ncbi:MAG TPA: FtsQ-type POTRA domain-containing protein [Thermoanaerobaculia bacterium]|jgi:cell division protein FtsQ